MEKAIQTLQIFIATVSKELLVGLILAIIMGAYLFIGSIGKTKRAVKRKENAVLERLMKDNIEYLIKVYLMRMTGVNKDCFKKGCEDYLKKNNLPLTKSSVARMLSDNMKVKNGDKALKKMYMSGSQADALIEATYKSLQLTMEQGPEFEKIKKSIDIQIKSMPNDISLAPQRSADFVNTYDDMTMQNQMMTDMQMQMQNQMMLDVQLQMQNQMMMDMQMQMQNQMMMDMQMQMQNQMMMDMQMQMQNQMMDMQMNNNLNDTAHMANMAITQTDFGGFMNNDTHSGNFL